MSESQAQGFVPLCRRVCFIFLHDLWGQVFKYEGPALYIELAGEVASHAGIHVGLTIS